MTLAHVFQPIDLGPATLPNRIARSAHGTALAQHGIDEDLIAYHEARARGGVGLTILEIALVHPSSPSPSGIPAWDRSTIAGYERLMERLGRYEMRVFQQLWHAGRHALPADGSPPWAPSAIPSVDLGVMPLAMSHDQIDELVEAFAAAAANAREGGLHGVEVHLAHGYLLNQFLSPLANQRDDEYGGPLENRLRFPLRVLQAVRDAVGSELAVGVRLNGEDGVPGGLSNADMVDVARRLDATGLLDFFNLSLGNRWAHHKMIGPMHEPHGYELRTSVPIAAAVCKPAIVTGRILNLQEAERVLAAGDADVVSMVRATIADPDLVRKTRGGLASRVRPCIGCNHGCFAGIRNNPPRIGCAVNVGAGRETVLGDDRLPPADVVRDVVVIGGGPAGLEAARVAALRGHRVTLYEATERLGGQLAYARRAPLRGDIGTIADWLAAELTPLGVDVHLQTPVDAAVLASRSPDAVIVATGATPRRDGFQAARPLHPLAGAGTMLTSWDILGADGAGAPGFGRRALVLDDLGHYEAIAVIDRLFEEVETVHLVTRFAELGTLVDSSLSAAPARERFGIRDFHVHPHSWLEGFADGGATIASLDADVRRAVDVDTVVLVSGATPRRPLDVVDGFVGPVHVVGDALGHRFLLTAVHDGNRAGRAV
jgi:2,4-dienoyl-CoA reductase-like NADH-dependent reductase (Old Yellow Enzyme family)